MSLLLNLDDLIKNLGNIEYRLDCSLKDFNKYGTGGNADMVVIPKSVNELIKVVNLVQNYPYFIIGNGSNLLVSDKGYKGVCISTKHVNKTDIKGNLYTAECGANLQKVIEDCKNNCLSGLEFACSIPATVGGAVFMNAGCYNKSISECVCYVITNKGTYNASECKFGYRTSRFKNGEVILKVCFSLTPNDEDIIEEKIKNYKGFRKNPKGKNCGSVFKNDGYFAGKIIDEVGLRGFSYKGAKVSLEHANFIVANANCTSNDIYTLINIIKDKVYKEKQILLNEEIIYLGDFK